MTDMRKRLYRDKKNGKISGVCSGLADYFNIDPAIVRIIWVVFLIFSFFMGIVIYIALVFLMNPKPEGEKPLLTQSADTTMSPEKMSAMLNIIADRFEKAEQKLTRLESYITSDLFDIKRRFSITQTKSADEAPSIAAPEHNKFSSQ